MNDARMTLRLPSEYLQFARNYATEREMTLTDLVIGYFKNLKESVAARDKLPECVRGMVGIIPAGKGDSVEEYHGHLMERYA